MNEFIEQFLIESRELIAQASSDLLALEHDPKDRPRLDSAFRAFHTLKGAAGIVDFTAMIEVTHATEDLLVAVRAGQAMVTPELVGKCLECLDQITLWLVEMETQGDTPKDAQAAADKLRALLTAGATAEPQTPNAIQPDDAVGTGLPPHAIRLLQAQLALIALPPDEGFLGRLGSAEKVIRNVLRHFNLRQPAEIAKVMASLHAAAMSETTPTETAPRAARTEVDRIDAIVKLAGELTVAKNALGHVLQTSGGSNPDALQKLHAQFDRMTSELRRQVLATRVLPLRHVFQRFPRLVREMAAGLGKPVRLVTEGDGTEADKAVVEALFEPILHVLRNAVDHGVEPPAPRAAAGKLALAVINLRAARAGDQVIIEIEDDGAGIDPATIRRVAAARGLGTPDALAARTDDDVLDLIFAPGFSTKNDVTDISGRGVGMDAVRTAIARLGGNVAVRSVPGDGTLIRFTLPYTVMMTRVLTVHGGGQVFGIPFESVVETIQLAPARILPVGAAATFALRGRTVPLLRLATALGLPETSAISGFINAVVIDTAGELSALQVDRFGGQLEIMLKPMDGLLAGMPWIAGTTLLGDGHVLIVLELQALLR